MSLRSNPFYKFVPVFASFWLLVVLFGLGILIVAMYNQSRAASWPTTDGVVTRSEVETLRTSDGQELRPIVKFVYSVEGVEHIGDRISFSGFSSGGRSAAELTVAAHPVGEKVVVRYDPADPSRSALRVGVGAMELIGALFMMTFLIVGVGMFWAWRTVGRACNPKVPAAGRRVMVRGGVTRVRLALIPPLVWALVAVFVLICVLSLMLSLFPIGATQTTALVAWGLALLTGAGVFAWRNMLAGGGRDDLVIDEAGAQLRLPRGEGRDEPLQIPFSEIRSIDATWKQPEWRTLRPAHAIPPAVDITLDGGREETVARFIAMESAELFADWLRVRLNLDGDADTST
ncbi:MAG: DUF3592 domain-containing protein [Phycisphaeraceae bacterium]|nr:MAG: DUF3592 domain-containing protein [Phycisphaeraceae bacterium]